MTLTELFQQHGRGKYLTDKGDDHSYFEIYDEMFREFQDKPCNFFEAGVQSGGDLKLFDDYFTQARIIGIDNNEVLVKYAPASNHYSPRVEVLLFDVRELTAQFFIDRNFMPDIAIDDCTHYLADQLHFVKTLYPIIKPGGLLIVEDIMERELMAELDKLGWPYEFLDMKNLRPDKEDNALIIYRK